MKDVDPTIGEEEIETAILEKQGLKVKVMRFINRTSGRGIPKVKVTFEKKEEMEAAINNSRLFIGTRSYRTEEYKNKYKNKNRILQCYRCQRFGHAQDSCKAQDRDAESALGPTGDKTAQPEQATAPTAQEITWRLTGDALER